MKFSDVAKGTRATRLVELPLGKGAEPFKTLVRPLTGDEELTALERARSYAIEKGINDPKVGDAIFDLAYMANVIALGCVDPDTPEEAQAPSFDGGAEQILESKVLDRERIAFLYEHHELWQDECSPQTKKVSDNELFNLLAKIAETEDNAPLVAWGPALRASLLRTTARLSLRSLADRSHSGPPDAKPSPKTPKPPAKRKR